MSSSPIQALRAALFPDDGQNTFAVIDGAACEELLPKLDQYNPEHVCLYAGELEPDLEECAPYLVSLLPTHPFTEWLVSHCLGKNWGIYASSRHGLLSLRKHFRSLLQVRSPENRTLYFRYYDPRVLTAYLPTTNASERESIFGVATSYFCESAGGDLLNFTCEQALLRRKVCVDYRTLSGKPAGQA